MNNELLVYNLKLLRARERITCPALAEILNFHLHRITDIENNPRCKVRDEEVKALADYFNVTITQLTTIKATVTF